MFNYGQYGPLIMFVLKKVSVLIFFKNIYCAILKRFCIRFLYSVERYGQLCFDEGVVDILKMMLTSNYRCDVKDLAERALVPIVKH